MVPITWPSQSSLACLFPPLPLTKHKYKTRTSSHTLLFAPLMFNFIALNQRISTCCGGCSLQAKCATSLSSPLRRFMSSSMPMLPFVGAPSLCLLKALHYFLSMHHVFFCYPSGFFLMVSLPLDQVLLPFALEIPTLKNPFHFILQMLSYKVGRWPYHLLVIWPQGILLEWFE